jgi:hypothetical protein
MATQEDRSKVIGSGTVDGLLAFCDYLIDKGYASSGAAGPWKSAAKQVFEAVEGENYGAADVRAIDLDDYLDRFETMERGNYKAESLASYGSRVRRAHEAYLAFLTDGRTPQLRRGPQRQDGDRPRPRVKPQTTPPGPTGSAVADLVEYPFPLRSGQLAYVRLPKKLEKADAERIAAFVRTLVFEPMAELTPGGNGDGDDA